jgi:hypothetical protein
MQPFKISGVAGASAYDPWTNKSQTVKVQAGGELVLPPFQRSLVVRVMRK